MPAKKGRGKEKPDPARENFEAGFEAVRRHPMFAPLLSYISVHRHQGGGFPEDGWVIAAGDGSVIAHPKRLAAPEEWSYVIAHCLLHYGLGHFDRERLTREWNVACDCIVARFLSGLKIGRPPAELDTEPSFSARSEERILAEIEMRGLPEPLPVYGTAGGGRGDMLQRVPQRWGAENVKKRWRDCFAHGVAEAVTSAVDAAGGRGRKFGGRGDGLSPARRAMSWFLTGYPLLGALASAFDLVEDSEICRRNQISVAAVDASTLEIFVNPAAGLDEQECRFVMAHELLHVGLRHQSRCRGRDAELWNVACDYVINGWLVEMGVGELPKVGVLYDPELKGLSAEAVYDRIVTDLRRYRKLRTLRGAGLGDMLGRGVPDWWATAEGVSLDEFYRRCLSQGLVLHQDQGRGFLPSGIIEEIRALNQPPLPWDVELAKWFDDHFAPIERLRSYARQSRRQSSTPDIPRPRWIPRPGSDVGRTFGVLLDTSGSMPPETLGKALGAIASYSIAREVPAVRVVFCDAAVYDQGYMAPEDIAGKVKVRGRGGTVLQPAVDFLQRAEDFPPEGPFLVITDGQCDRLAIRREHAFLVPEGRSLPFVPKGPVFRLR